MFSTIVVLVKHSCWYILNTLNRKTIKYISGKINEPILRCSMHKDQYRPSVGTKTNKVVSMLN